jgi:uncharacterized membrane protein HdeD (DUF308 family)
MRVEIDVEDLAGEARVATRFWWVFVATGILWILFAFVVLSASIASVWAVAVLFGIGFISGGILELVTASLADRYRWMHVLFGVVSIVAGVVALAWPGQTFVVLAAIVGWYLAIDGLVTTIVAISTRNEHELWWLGLLIGVAQLLIGFWAIGYVGRSVALLLVWVAAGALGRGISSLMIGMSLHGADRELRRALAS